MKQFIAMLPVQAKSYYFGSAGFSIISQSEFEKAQLGYRTHPDGSDLTGEQEGEWFPCWYFVGNDTSVGDPFFVDTSKDSLPVYTAMHGQGEWSPDLVSQSFSSFLTSIQYLQEQSKQDAELIEPNKDTITDEDQLENIYKHIMSLCGEDAGFFWECFFEQHEDWIIESEEY